MTLRRGFKSQAENYSLEYRKFLGLKYHDCLSARDLATFLNLKILGVNQIIGLTENEINLICSGEFSAVAIVNYSIIIYNHLHSIARQESDLMHEYLIIS